MSVGNHLLCTNDGSTHLIISDISQISYIGYAWQKPNMYRMTCANIAKTIMSAEKDPLLRWESYFFILYIAICQDRKYATTVMAKYN